MSDTLTHKRNCPSLSNSFPVGDGEDCTCGLYWRIALQTEQTMHAAWRKRAEEAEASLAEARDSQRKADCAAVCPACGDTASWQPAQWKYEKWTHLCTSGMKNPLYCAAGPIHELAHRETLTAQSEGENLK